MPDTVTPRQAQGWLASGRAVLIDVREPHEFSAAHIPYALSAPLAGVAAMLKDMDLPADRKIVFQCQKGGRGGQACAAVGAVAPGGQPVFNLEGGIDAWAAGACRSSASRPRRASQSFARCRSSSACWSRWG